MKILYPLRGKLVVFTSHHMVRTD
jgi:hypothetical protein